MMLGKRARARPPMKRTTSMTEFSFDDLTVHVGPARQSDQPLPEDDDGLAVDRVDNHHHHLHGYANHNLQHQRVMALVSPRVIHRRNSADLVLTRRHSSDSFLTTCCLCQRRLAPGRDIYMYRGDSAFCSLECRQQQMTQDEWREKERDKCSLVSSIKESNPSSHSPTAGPRVSSSATGETVAAL